MGFHASFQKTLQDNIESLRNAQARQQDQMQAGMDEVKGLLLRQRSPGRKRPAEAPPGMELDG